MYGVAFCSACGELADDPKCGQGKTSSYAMFRVKVNYPKKPGSEEKYGPTAWLSCKAFGFCADKLQGATKGDIVHIAGRMVTENWQDKDGNKRSALNLIAEHVEYFGRGKQASPTTAAPAQGQAQQPPRNPNALYEQAGGDESDIPF